MIRSVVIRWKTGHFCDRTDRGVDVSVLYEFHEFKSRRTKQSIYLHLLTSSFLIEQDPECLHLTPANNDTYIQYGALLASGRAWLWYSLFVLFL